MFTKDVIFFQKAVVKHPQDSRFLILQRSPTSSMPNTWDFPGGGVDFGENHVASIIREIREETSLIVQAPQVLDVFSRYAPQTKTYHLCVGYQCQALSETVHLSEEHIAYQWISADAFAKINTWDFLKSIVRKTYQTPDTTPPLE